MNEAMVEGLAKMKMAARAREEAQRERFYAMAAAQGMNPFEFHLATGGDDDYHAVESPDDVL